MYPPGFIGGYELGALEVSRYLIQKGHQVSVLTSDYFTDDEQQLRDHVVERILEFRGLGPQLASHPVADAEATTINWRNLRKISSAIRRFQPDLVLTYNLAGLGPLGIVQFLNALEMPTVLYFMDSFRDGDGLTRYERLFGKFTVGTHTHVVTMSKTLLDRVERYLGGIEGRVSFIPGWVDLSLTRASEPRSRNSPRRFVFCSRLEQNKGTDLIVTAAHELVQEGITSFEIDLYGSGSQLSALLRGIAFRRLDSVVKYKGQFEKEKMIGLFAGYDALLFPTHTNEPFGFVACEAAANGCVPLMTSQAGASEWFVHGVDCLKFEHNIEAIKTSVKAIIQMPDAELEHFKQRTKLNAQRYFAMEHWMREIETICKKMGTGKRPVVTEQRLKQVQASFLALSELWHEEVLQ
jgi:glycosyltransferase involved in cell wall biosynthesis